MGDSDQLKDTSTNPEAFGVREPVFLKYSDEKHLFKAAKIAVYDFAFISLLFFLKYLGKTMVFNYFEIGNDSFVQVIFYISDLMLIILYIYLVFIHLQGFYQKKNRDIEEQQKW